MIETLSRDEVCRVIDGNGCARRVPIMFQKWVGPDIYKDPEHTARLHKLLDEHPQDMQVIHYRNVPIWDPPPEDASYCWMHGIKPPEVTGRGIDEDAPLSDWAMLDDILANFPKANSPVLIARNPVDDGRFMFTLGNGATPDIPIASLEALFDEAYACAEQKRLT